MFKKHVLTAGALAIASIAVAVMALSPKAGSEEIKVSVDPYIERASIYFLEGRYADGVSEAAKAVERDPDDPRGYNFLTANYAGLGNYSQAIEASRKQLSILEAKGIFDVNIMTRHAALLEVGVGPGTAIEFLESYGEKFPNTVAAAVAGIEKAGAAGTLYYRLYNK